jgi:hypothetical protein
MTTYVNLISALFLGSEKLFGGLELELFFSLLRSEGAASEARSFGLTASAK